MTKGRVAAQVKENNPGPESKTWDGQEGSLDSEEGYSEDSIDVSTSADSASDSEARSDREGGEMSDASDVDLSFTGYNMDHRDYHSIQQFITQIFGRGLQSLRGGDSGVVECTELAKIVVDGLGEYVGTTAKAEESEDPLAFITLIPLELPGLYFEERDKAEAFLKSLGRMLMGTARKSKIDKKKLPLLEQVLIHTPQRTALVLAERFMNLPVDVAAPLYQQLLDDLPAATEEDPSFTPDHILLITPIYRELVSDLDSSTMGESARKKCRKQPIVENPHDNQEAGDSDFFYYYAEDELLPEISSIYWDFRIKTPHETADSRRTFGDRGIDPARRVFLLTMEEFKTFVHQCQAFL